MGGDARLNLLLTSPPAQSGGPALWRQTLSQLLLPLGVRTFQAQSGPQAVELLEQHPIHLAVLDSRLPAISGLTVLELIQRLRSQASAAPSPTTQQQPPPADLRLEVRVEQQGAGQNSQRRIEVRFDARPAERKNPGPVVILIAPPPQQQDPQLLQEALKFNAFSVLSEPVDINLALELMARAMKRFHQNQWPA